MTPEEKRGVQIETYQQLETWARKQWEALIIPPFYKQPISPIGVNFFDGSMAPGHVNYKMPLSDALWAFWAARGVNVARVAFKWERAQPTLLGPLDAAHTDAMHAVVAMAKTHGMRVLWNCHNYGKREGTGLIGAADGPTREEFADLWARIAFHFQNSPEVIGYGLMNEPGWMSNWPLTIQTTVNAVRNIGDTKTAIMVPGVGVGHAWQWADKNGNLSTVVDPSNRLVFEAHQYIDQDSSGRFITTWEQTFGASWVQTLPDPMDFGKALIDGKFVKWLGTERRGIIGETGIPSGMVLKGDGIWGPSSKYKPEWVEALRRMLVFAADSKVPVFLWTDGMHAETNLLYVGHKAPDPDPVKEMLAGVLAERGLIA